MWKALKYPNEGPVVARIQQAGNIMNRGVFKDKICTHARKRPKKKVMCLFGERGCCFVISPSCRLPTVNVSFLFSELS